MCLTNQDAAFDASLSGLTQFLLVTRGDEPGMALLENLSSRNVKLNEHYQIFHPSTWNKSSKSTSTTIPGIGSARYELSPWPRLATSIALGRGACLRSPPSGRAYVIISESGGLRSRGPCPILVQH
ncbi:hypothetical protein V6N12_033802 [Hibiscus sabdariffa]|uniref:Uncharacterized protein n=1 Tax=Hibiscus sabdariffa TaxID=183260 RepID=A0ABR2AN46_9ROSI